MKHLFALLTAIVFAAPAYAAPVNSDMIFNARLGALRQAALSGRTGEMIHLASTQERDVLVRLLRDPDASVRQAAVRSLKNYVGQTSRTRDAVLSVFSNTTEEAAVRYEAAKTLSFVAHDNRVRNRLINYAQRGGDSSLRAISYKALYTQAAGHSRFRDQITSAALREPDPEVRRAAVWTLFTASRNSRVRDALVRIVRGDSEMDIRVEALKSLYGAMGHLRVRNWVRSLARDGSSPAELRYPSILLLSAIIDSRTRRTLTDLARYSENAELREAAILAMNPRDIKIVRYFHLVRRLNNGTFLDPLENE